MLLIGERLSIPGPSRIGQLPAKLSGSMRPIGALLIALAALGAALAYQHTQAASEAYASNAASDATMDEAATAADAAQPQTIVEGV